MINDDIVAQLADAVKRRPNAITAHTYMKGPNQSFAKPVWLNCSDGQTYVVKGQQAGRSIFNDQVIARLGQVMGAPIPEPALVMIPEELQRNEPKMHGIAPGLAHGTVLIDDTSDKQWLAYTDKEYNRPRFGMLAVLYGWLQASDRQLIYSNHDPYLVYSVDHGHFFPSGPDWTLASLSANAACELHEELRRDVSLSNVEIRAGIGALRKTTNNHVVEAIAAPPDEWGVNLEERAALANFIIARQAELLQEYS